ncbi:MAG: hypothetical protein HOP96_08765 [Sphingomonas sp.]|nr:hypothetical protein [Sphingomonas sp.]
MRIAFIGLTAMLAGCTAPPPVASNAPLAEIAGRVAGPAQRCVTTTQSEGLHAANRSTLTVRSGRTIWVNHLQDGCSGFGQWDVLVTEPIGTQYCSGDLVRSFDSLSKIPGPSCRLGEFIPFTRS